MSGEVDYFKPRC